VDDDPEFYVPPVWRGRSENVKQGSGGVVTDGQADLTIGSNNARALQDYKKLLSLGVCPEQARGVLPTSTMTEFWWSGSLDAWSKMCKLRMAPDSQYESQIVARAISAIMNNLFKHSWAALMPPMIRPFTKEESGRAKVRSKINKT
jgi:thymidylate synthase (FAD)